MTEGQRVSFEYHGNNYIFTVSQAAVEGQEKSNASERGMISNDTYFVFETSNASGIKASLLVSCIRTCFLTYPFYCLYSSELVVGLH